MKKEDYLEISWNCGMSEEDAELLTSFLAELGFDSFYEEQNFYKAYIPEVLYSESKLKKSIQQLPHLTGLLDFQVAKVEQKNWNSEWESNFQPVLIANSIFIKAPFHTEQKDVPYTLTIQPKMSFGTGHHETTSGMLEMLLEIDCEGKDILDMGSGTAVLSVFASKRGAKQVIAIDNDPVCYENALENISLNTIDNVVPLTGDGALLKNMQMDIILANINRNVLLSDIPLYKQVLKPGGQLLLSGFYLEDLPLIEQCCKENNFVQQQWFSNNNWIIALYKKL